MATKTTLLLALLLFSTVAYANEIYVWQGRVNWGPGGDHVTIEAGSYQSVTVYKQGFGTTDLHLYRIDNCNVVATLYDENENVIETRTIHARFPEDYLQFGPCWTWVHNYDFCTVPYP